LSVCPSPQKAPLNIETKELIFCNQILIFIATKITNQIFEFLSRTWDLRVFCMFYNNLSTQIVKTVTTWLERNPSPYVLILWDGNNHTWFIWVQLLDKNLVGNFFNIKLRNLFGKFQFSSFKTEVGVWGDRQKTWAFYVKKYNFALNHQFIW